MCHAGAMFERFTDVARQSIVRSQWEARALNQTSVGTEDLLVGVLAQQDPILNPILEAHGVDVQAVRERVKQVLGTDGEPPSGHIPFTPEVKKALELSLRESLELGHNHIGPAHLLLGLLQQGDNGGVRVLRNLHVDVEELAHKIRSQAGGETPIKELDVP
jgi:ATP-dependent Clp protease ATP-binding subunit ClpC